MWDYLPPHPLRTPYVYVPLPSASLQWHLSTTAMTSRARFSFIASFEFPATVESGTASRAERRLEKAETTSKSDLALAFEAVKRESARNPLF